jgi:uncharacterized lipoprotein YbaY
MKMKGSSLAHCAALLALALTGCSKSSAPAPADATIAIAGAAQSSAPINLSADAQFEVQLLEVVSGMGPQLLASQRIRNPGSGAIAFKLEVPQAKVAATKHYQLMAQVMDRGQVLLQTTSPIDVSLSGKTEPVQITLTAVDNGANDTPTKTASARPVFEPHYSGNELTRITESRTTGDRVERIDYGFKGARLIDYISRDATQSGHEVRVRFSNEGKLLSAIEETKGVKTPLPHAQLDAIRDRAAMLRSLALAQRASAAEEKRGETTKTQKGK